MSSLCPDITRFVCKHIHTAGIWHTTAAAAAAAAAAVVGRDNLVVHTCQSS